MNIPLVIAAPVLATALIAGAGAPAFADTSSSTPAPSTSPSSGAASSGKHHLDSLSAIQAAGAAQTAKRITSLNNAITRIQNEKDLSSSDQSALVAAFNTDLTGMKTLQAKIAADTTVSAARTDLHSIHKEYRVYAVTLHQARVVREADRLTGTTIPKLQAEASKLAPKVASQTSLQGDLADMNTQITTATSDSQGLSAAALAVTPADYNSNHTVLTSLTAKAKAAKTAVQAARKDARTIRQALKAAGGGHHHHNSSSSSSSSSSSAQ